MRVLYVSHNAVGSPVVRSQVLPYLARLMDRHDIRLLTFERSESYPEDEFPRDRWSGVTPRPGASLPAKVVDVVRGALAVIRTARAQQADLLHARSHVAAAICWLAGAILRIPYVFDMRGFMPEEYRDAGLWTSDDLRFRIARAAELHLLRGAGEIVVLTEAAARRLRSDPHFSGAARGKRITVIPCAVDLDRFRPGERADDPTLVYSGSLGMWYLLDEMLTVYGHARQVLPSLRLLILNRGEHALIASALQRHGLGQGVEVRAADFARMPAELARAHVAIALLRRVPSKIGSSPIKIAEYLACGLPVVVSAGLGDSDEQITGGSAGYVMSAFDDASCRAAGRAVVDLVADPGARERARHVAEAVFDVRSGADAYDSIYCRVGSR